MMWFFKRLILFYLFFNFEMTWAQRERLGFLQRPPGCVQNTQGLCDISSGPKSYQFLSGENQWEMAAGTVLRREKKGFWKMAEGRFVVHARRPIKIETPYGFIHVGRSKAFIDLGATRVNVANISGEPVRLVSRAPGHEFSIHPGMEKWISGMGPQGLEVGSTQVMDLQRYAKDRVHFFSSYEDGFSTELAQLGTEIQKASEILAFTHQKNVQRKMAMLQEQHEKDQDVQRRRRDYNRYLQNLFRKKSEYDY